MDLTELSKQLHEAIVSGDQEVAEQVTRQALEGNQHPIALISEVVTPALEEVGRSFECGDAYLPQLILSGDAAIACLKLIIPTIPAQDQQSVIKGKVVIGTIYGDAHDIGKNIVIGMLAAHGMEVVDLGINVPVRDYVEAALKENADIIAVSSLLTTTLPYQRELIATLRERDLRHRFFVIVGGGPVTPQWTASIGADGYGRDAKDAAALCVRLMSLRRAGATAPLAEPISVGALRHD